MKKINLLLRKFIMASLQINSIQHEDLYLLGWSIDLFSIFLFSLKIINGKRKWVFLLLGLSIIALVILVWVGLKCGIKEGVTDKGIDQKIEM